MKMLRQATSVHLCACTKSVYAPDYYTTQHNAPDDSQSAAY